MKKFLPRTSLNPQGFTLVELLVVVSIIAILSVIGVATFTNVQKNARDARRKADIDAIAAAFESTYSNGAYSTVQASNFSSGTTPNDPLNDTTNGYVYNTVNPAATAVEITAGTASIAPIGTANTSFTVCAKLEDNTKGNSGVRTSIDGAGTAFYCRANQQ